MEKPIDEIICDNIECNKMAIVKIVFHCDSQEYYFCRGHAIKAVKDIDDVEE